MSEILDFQTTTERSENREQLRRRILVADDDSSLLKITVFHLKALGYEVVAVTDGTEILEKLNAGDTFDAIITDNNMKRMHGIDALAEIRKNPEFNDLPVIVHSATLTPEIEQRVRELGSACLAKPPTRESLKKALDEVFGENIQ